MARHIQQHKGSRLGTGTGTGSSSSESENDDVGGNDCIGSNAVTVNGEIADTVSVDSVYLVGLVKMEFHRVGYASCQIKGLSCA